MGNEILTEIVVQRRKKDKYCDIFLLVHGALPDGFCGTLGFRGAHFEYSCTILFVSQNVIALGTASKLETHLAFMDTLRLYYLEKYNFGTKFLCINCSSQTSPRGNILLFPCKIIKIFLCSHGVFQL